MENLAYTVLSAQTLTVDTLFINTTDNDSHECEHVLCVTIAIPNLQKLASYAPKNNASIIWTIFKN